MSRLGKQDSPPLHTHSHTEILRIFKLCKIILYIDGYILQMQELLFIQKNVSPNNKIGANSCKMNVIIN